MMRKKILYSLLAAALVGIAFYHNGSSAAPAGQNRRVATVCADPTVACKTSVTFEPFDLPFRVPATAGISETQPFYAIILTSVAHANGDCDHFVSEADRLSAQELFPHRKVFSSRCANPGGLFYTNVSPKAEFMAVYAGATRAEAARTLVEVSATGKFLGANIRQMRAGFNGT
jgi:hypothetical protein